MRPGALPKVIQIPDDGHCLFAAVAYGATGMKGKLPAAQRLSAMGQAHRQEVVAWIDAHRAVFLGDVPVEVLLRTELEDDPGIKATAAWVAILQYIRTPRYYGSGVAMYAMEQLFPVSIACYELGARGLRISRPAGGAREGAASVHVLHKNGNHYDLFRSAPPVDTVLGLDISGPVSEAARSGKRPPPLASEPVAKRLRVKGKQAAEPSRGTVLKTVASMTGSNSGGKTKAVKELERQGFPAAAARRSLRRLCDEKAVYPSQTRRRLRGGTMMWRALRANKPQVAAANIPGASPSAAGFLLLIAWLVGRLAGWLAC